MRVHTGYRETEPLRKGDPTRTVQARRATLERKSQRSVKRNAQTGVL